ncbi:hypothetical protein L2E82_45438 [Cichorium intybus]|uniref:Uncharacterized protein n=1 Tax=Cichorium intybus TaxID=13427 RepID=A0ACB8ZTV2_CICIN|nr:hypothetical protein L2E82_45438 [Cichorium intybus]
MYAYDSLDIMYARLTSLAYIATVKRRSKERNEILHIKRNNQHTKELHEEVHPYGLTGMREKNISSVDEEAMGEGTSGSDGSVAPAGSDRTKKQNDCKRCSDFLRSSDGQRNSDCRTLKEKETH